jgi:competence protein ComFC
MGTWIVKGLRYLLQCVLAAIYDDNDGCIICGREEEKTICRSCSSKVNKCSISSSIEKEGVSINFFCSAYYSGVVKELIIRLKYKSDFNCGEALAEMMRETIEKSRLNFDLITFVPSGKKALRKRGYNQSEFLAQLLGRSLDKRVLCCLKKVTDTKDQIGLDGRGRWENLNECFKSSNMEMIRGQRMLLVDDVITTGATAFYCARELINGGCSEVIVLTAAKSTV